MSLPPVDFKGLRAAKDAKILQDQDQSVDSLPDPIVRATPWTEEIPNRNISTIRKAAQRRGMETSLTYAKGWYYDGNGKITGPHESLLLSCDRAGEHIRANWERRGGVKNASWTFRWAFIATNAGLQRVTSAELGRYIKGQA